MALRLFSGGRACSQPRALQVPLSQPCGLRRAPGAATMALPKEPPQPGTEGMLPPLRCPLTWPPLRAGPRSLGGSAPVTIPGCLPRSPSLHSSSSLSTSPLSSLSQSLSGPLVSSAMTPPQQPPVLKSEPGALGSSAASYSSLGEPGAGRDLPALVMSAVGGSGVLCLPPGRSAQSQGRPPPEGSPSSPLAVPQGHKDRLCVKLCQGHCCDTTTVAPRWPVTCERWWA